MMVEHAKPPRPLVSSHSRDAAASGSAVMFSPNSIIRTTPGTLSGLAQNVGARSGRLFRMRNRCRADGDELHQILAKEYVERPVERDAQFLLQARQLAQVDRPPEPPRDKTGKIDAEYLRHPRAAANGCQLPDCVEGKVAHRPFAADGSHQVSCQRSGLPQRVLRGRRIEAALAVRNQCAVADRPEPRMSRNAQR